MAWPWVERDEFLVRYTAYKKSQCKDAEEIKCSHVWEPKSDSVY